MKQFYNQFKKDVRQILVNPVFFLMAGLCCSIWGFVFPRRLFEFARVAGVSPYAGPGMMGGGGYNIYETVFMNHLSLTHLLLLFIVPVFTMRLIAEEKKLRTFDLLLSAPVTSTTIVLAKFCAGYCSALILIFLSFLYPLSTSWFVEFNMLLLAGAYLSIALLVGIYVSIGLFSSSLSASIMLSVFLGIIFNVALHFVSMSGGVFNNPVYSAVMEYLSVSSHLNLFFRGNITSGGILFFFIVMGFFVFMTQRVMESYRWRAQ